MIVAEAQTFTMNNLEIARLLRKIAAAYTILRQNRFKIIAYENAATSVEHAGSELKDLWDDGKLETVPGLGESIISHLDEIFRTGKSKHFDAVLAKIRPAVFEFLEIPGLGPKKAYKLVYKLNLKDISDLESAAKAHKIASLEDFGLKSEADILENIARFRKGAVKERRMTLLEADAIADEVIGFIRGIGNIRIDKLGSLRRRVATIGDVDLAVATDHPKEVIEAFVAYPRASGVIEKGPTGASILVAGHHQVDLRVSRPEEYGAMLQYFTGSKYHNIKLRELALKKGLSLSEYGMKPIQNSKFKSQNSSSKIKSFDNEEEFYNFLGLDWIPPELREDGGEIEAALEHKLPKLVELKDVKGDLHLHSNFDLETSHDSGTGTIREIREMGELRGYEYVGISDHNPSVTKHSPKQIEESLRARKMAVEQINSSTHGCRVLNLLEVDIAPDGTLPVPNVALDNLDACVVSVHSTFTMEREKMTKRVLAGLSHPVAKILGHPTGRLLGQREGYELDWDEIFAFCAKNDKALEINCFPNRLDLPDVLVREAIKRGVLLSLGTDYHDVGAMDLMEFGVCVARRGWAEKEDIINSWSYSKIFSWLSKRQS